MKVYEVEIEVNDLVKTNSLYSNLKKAYESYLFMCGDNNVKPKSYSFFAGRLKNSDWISFNFDDIEHKKRLIILRREIL